MRRGIIGLLALALVLAGCSSDAEPESLTDSEAIWCRATQPGFRLLEAGAEMGIDLTDVVDEAAEIADAPGTPEERQDALEAAYRTLESHAGYIEVCRSLYEEAGRPFDLQDDLP
jgi:hypothetical protein